MRLVNNDVLEGELLEGRFLDKANLIGCDEYVEILRDQPIRDESRTLFFSACEYNSVDVRRPPFELARPVLQR